jgi:hypothetical protein
VEARLRVETTGGPWQASGRESRRQQARELLDFRHDPVQFLRQAARTEGPERVGKGAVVPQGPRPTAIEAGPQRLTNGPVVAENGAGIVELVGGRDQAD